MCEPPVLPKITKPWEQPVEDYDVEEEDNLVPSTRIPAPTECAYCGISPLSPDQFSPFPEDYVGLYDCECQTRSYCGEECMDDDWETHEANCSQRNYILRISLCPTVLINPPVTRTLSFPRTATFADLHWAIMVAFGWLNTREEWRFELIDHGGPLSYRHVPPTMRLAKRFDGFLKLFQKIAGEKPSVVDFGIFMLRYVVSEEIWEHHVCLIGTAPPTALIECIDGLGHACTEGLGGPQGWKELLLAYDADDPNEEQQELQALYEEHKNTEGLRGSLQRSCDMEKINNLLWEFDIHPHTSDPSLHRTCRTKRSVLLLSLNKDDAFDKDYKDTITGLHNRAIVRQVTSIAGAMFHLMEDKTYQTVIVTDCAVFEREFHQVHKALEHHAAVSRPNNAVIFGFRCGRILNPQVILRINKGFKSTWKRDWVIGLHSISQFVQNSTALALVTKNMVRLNPDLRDVECTSYYDLVQDNQFAARCLKSSNESELLYVADKLPGQSPVVLSEHSKGFVGWLGYPVIWSEEREILYKICGI
ncbi:hypothetical protein V8E51_007207 [Hyaloscypha variabilis]